MFQITRVQRSVPMPDPTVHPEFTSPGDLAIRLGISRSASYNLLDEGVVRSVRLGGRRLIPCEEADRLVAELHAADQ
jgi:excisionase family DNA binding protein